MVQTQLDALLSQWFPIPPGKIAVAVSGGVDSMALVYGLYHWAARHGKTIIVPIIVDHRLRTNSRQEAQQVAQALKEWGLDPVVLPWVHSSVVTGVMEKARTGRYGIMAMACHKRGIHYMFVGHHQDDMLETVWMRQQMQGPERGWAGISAVTMRYGIVLLRPFLHTPKTELEHWMRSNSVSWVEDPSNHNPDFYRTHARYRVQSWGEKTRTEAWDQLIQRGNDRCAKEQGLRHLTSVTHDLGYVLVEDFTALAHLPNSEGCVWVQAWVHSFVFRPIAGIAGQEQLWRRLCSAFQQDFHNPGRIVATFAGCVFIRNHQQLWIFREHARIGTMVICGDTHLWDDRIFADHPILLSRANWQDSGSWQERWIRAGLPKQWNPLIMHYRPCSWPYPHFATLYQTPLNPIFLQSN
jgi:tRNA(Ile)-lysidine synthetase-like protein